MKKRKPASTPTAPASPLQTPAGAETSCRLLLEAMNEGAATVTRDGTILYCNRRLVEMAGLPAGQVVGSSLCQLVVPAQQAAARGLVAAALQSGARAEFTFQAPDGPGLPVLLSLRPMHRDAETIAVVVADLSEHKRADAALQQAHDSLEQRVRDRTEELRQEREWLSVTLGSIGDALIATDAAGRIAFLNPVAETLTGWPRQEALGQPVQSVFRILDETTRIPGEDVVARVLREGAPIKLANNTCLIARAGQEIPIEDSAAPIKDREGKVAGAVLVFHDVTAKRRAQRALRESEERLRLLVEGTKDCALFMLDPQGHITTWNEGGRRLKGYEATEVIGRHFSVFYTPEDMAAGKPARELEAAQREGKYEEEGERVRKDGSRFWASVLITPLWDEQGRLRGFSKVTRDISGRKQAEAAVSQSQQTFSELVERSPFGTYIVDSQFRIAMMNASSQTGAFRNVRPVIGRPFDEAMRILWPEPVAAEIIGHFRRTLDTGEPYYSPRFINPRHDVQIVEAYEWELHRMTLPDGQYGVICYYFDSTELRTAEQALRESEGRLKHAQQVANVGSWEWDIQTGALWWSEQTYRQMGEEPGQFTPTHDLFRQRVHPEDRAAFEAAIVQALAGTAPYDLEFRILCRDGAVRVLHSRGEVLPGPDGRPRGMAGVCLDITERKQAEAALRVSEARRQVAEAVQAERQRLQEVLNLLPAYVVLLSPDYRVPFANRFFEERFGKSEGRRCYEYLFNRTEPCENCLTYNVLKTNAPQRWEWTGPDGHNYDIHDFPFTDVDGSPLIMEVGLDITERKQAEGELTKHRQHLQELVNERTKELRATNSELRRFNEAMVGRELRMIELKREINALCAQFRQPPRYGPDAGEQARPAQ